MDGTRRGAFIYVITYVDDSIIMTNCWEFYVLFENFLKSRFEMKFLYVLEDYIGVEIRHEQDALGRTTEVEMLLTKYIEKAVKDFEMIGLNPAPTPHATTGSLTEAMCPTSKRDSEEMSVVPFAELKGTLQFAANVKIEILYTLKELGRFLQNPGKAHWTALKRCLRYLHGARFFGLKFTKDGNMKLVVFTDSDYAGEKDGRRSTTCVVVMFGNVCIMCISRTQKCVALSSCEAELVGLTEGAREAVYLRNFLNQSKLAETTDPTLIAGDNQGSLALARNPVFHDRSKHIATRWYYVRDMMAKREIAGVYVHTKSQLADIGTKGNHSAKHFKALTMMVCGYLNYKTDTFREQIYYLSSE